MNDFLKWKEFEHQTAAIQLWVFKKSKTQARYRAWHVRTDEGIEKIFREILERETRRITEFLPYAPLTQNNANSCLIHPLEQNNDLESLLIATNKPENENAETQLKQIMGAAGYLVKYQQKDQTIYAIKKTAQTWKPTKRAGFFNVLFIGGELSVEPHESFTINNDFDFYCINSTILIAARAPYESLTGDKEILKKTFEDLASDPDFLAVISNIDEVRKYVGTNTTHLRRMATIKARAVFTTSDFLKRVRIVSESRGWNIRFDPDGKMIMSEETASATMQVLLDHRLISEITEITYDVPDAQAI